MKYYLPIFLFLALAYEDARSQSVTISGKIAEQTKRQGLDYATVVLIRLPDSVVLWQQFSNEQGNYSFKDIQPGKYLIEGYFMGYKKSRTEMFEIANVNYTVPTLFILPELNNLKEVIIKANKPLIERKIDRMVFNLENSIAAKGTDLTQALALTPMLRVEESGVSIIGKGNVSIMINERMVNLSGNDLVNYLKSLRSDDVEKIEVITTPPAKYEAQGNSGLINIVIKSNPNMGWSGNFSPSLIQNTYSSFANNINLNYQSKKLSSSVKLRQYHRLAQIEEQTNNIGVNSILSSDPRKNVSDGWGTNFSLDYKTSKRANIGFIYDLSKTKSVVDINNTTVYQTNNLTDSTLTTFSKNLSPNLVQTFNAYYDQKLDSLGKKLSAGFNFFSTKPETTNNFQTTSNQTLNTDIVRNYSGTKNNIWAVQSDLTLPYNWVLIETGAKFTNFNNNSNVAYYNFVLNKDQLDLQKSNSFEYQEQNLAGYLSLQKELNKKWSAKAGLRYEYTFVDGYSPTENARNQSDYGKFFPTIYLSFKPNAKNTLSINYSKRINRPNLRAINPARWYSNPYTYFTGNPYLKPSYNHNIELSYLTGNLSFTAYGQKLVNGYGYLVVVNDAFKVVNAANYLRQYNTGITVSLNQKFFAWWENSSYASYSYSNSSSILPQVLTQNGSAFYYNINNNFKANKQISAFVNFRHSLSSRQNNVYNQYQYALSAGARYTLFDNRFQVNASVNDILKSDLTRNQIYFADAVQYGSTYYDTRFLNLNVTYTFGKPKVRGNTKQVNFKETQRAN